MHRIPLASSTLASVLYWPNRRALEVEFHSGKIYRYLEVPPQTYNELLVAPSKGRYFNIAIRNRFTSQQINIIPSARATTI